MLPSVWHLGIQSLLLCLSTHAGKEIAKIYSDGSQACIIMCHGMFAYHCYCNITNAFHCYVYPDIIFLQRSTFNADRVTQLSRKHNDIRKILFYLSLNRIIFSYTSLYFTLLRLSCVNLSKLNVECCAKNIMK